MPAKKIAIINQKGGVGKTTVAFELGSILNALKSRVLLVDMDPQCNLSSLMGAKLNDYSVLDALLGNAETRYIIQKCKYGDILISNGNLASYEKRFSGSKSEYRFREILDSVIDNYDYIIVDSPPALGVLTVGILTACDGFIIPATADLFSAQGIEQVYSTYEAVKAYTNPKLQIYGVLLSRYNFAFDKKVFKVVADTCKKLDIELFPTVICESVKIRESLIEQKSLMDYAPKSDVMLNYLTFTRSFIRKVSGGNMND